MITQKHFNKRKQDIEEVFKLLDFIGRIETHRSHTVKYDLTEQSLSVSQEMQCILKSQFLLILYNLIESTVNDCLHSIYDSIEDDGLAFADLNDEIKLIWLKYNKLEESLDSAKMNPEIMCAAVKFPKLPISISGNIDMRKIFDLFPMHGCMLQDNNRYKYSNSFLTVKNRRNSLAHGNISFSECGSAYMVSDIRKIMDDIICGLQEVITQVKAYTSSKKYRHTYNNID